ncbi:MAG: MFS transporter [Elusimicrobia bacterium]|nr:MFS transporter [Elusimicrobiota bacterium]
MIRIIRAGLAALYLISIPGASAWAQVARVAEISAPVTAPAPAVSPLGAAAPNVALTPAALAPSLAPAPVPAPALSAAAAQPAAPTAASAAAATAEAAAAVPAPAPESTLAAASLAAATPSATRASFSAARLFDGLRRRAGSEPSVPAVAGREAVSAPRLSAASSAAEAPALPPAPSPRAPRLRGYLSGAFLAQLASNSQQVTMPLLFLKMTGAAAPTAYLLALGSALDAAGTLIGGRMTDRWGAKNVLILSTIARGAAVVSLPILAAAGALGLPVVVSAYVVESLCRGLADTARSTLPVELSSGHEGLLKTILAKNQLFLEAGGVAGPFVAAALIAGLGGVAAPAALWLAPIVFALVTAAYVGIPRVSRAVDAPDAPTATGAAAKTDGGWMRWALMAAALLTVYPLKGLLPAVFATQVLQSDAAAGWLTGMFGVGGLLGALAYGRFGRSVTARTWLTGGALGTAAFAAAFLPGSFAAAAAAIMVFAAANVAARLALSAAIQMRAPPGRSGAAMGPARFAANISGLGIRLLAGLAFSAAFLPSQSFRLVAAGLGVAALLLAFVARRLTAPLTASARRLGLAAALGVLPATGAPRLSAVHGLPGRLIVVEGLDGSGKSTQMERLKEELEARGVDVVATSWNSSDLVSDAVKKAKKARALDARTFALLNAADLADRLDKTILPALRAGSVVLADRWYFTALARDRVRGNEPKWLDGLYASALKPDLTLYFRLPTATAIERVLARAQGKPGLSEDFDEDASGKVLGQNYYAVGRDQNFSSDDLENFRQFQTRVAAQYDAQARRFGFRMIDAAKDRDTVTAATFQTAFGALGTLSSFRRRDQAKSGNLFDKDPAGDADNIRRNYMKEKRGAHFYFRNMLLPMQERFVQLMNVSAMPRALLHGSPHVDNYAKSSQGAAMVDFDRSRVGPYAWDLLRLMVSLSLRRKKSDEDLLDKSALKQLRKGYRHGLRHPDRPFSEARLLKDVEAGPHEESVDAYLKADGKWAAEMRENPLPVDNPDVVALVQGYDRSLGGAILSDYRIEEAGRGQGSMGFRGLFLVVLAPRDEKSGRDRILLNIKQVRADPDTEWFKNPYATQIQRMHAAADVYAPGWAPGAGWAVLDGVEYDVRRIDPLNAKIKKMLNLESQADLAYAVGTQLGRAHRLTLQDGATAEDVERHLDEHFDALVAAGVTIRDELLAAHARYLKKMARAGLTPSGGGDEQ